MPRNDRRRTGSFSAPAPCAPCRPWQQGDTELNKGEGIVRTLCAAVDDPFRLGKRFSFTFDWNWRSSSISATTSTKSAPYTHTYSSLYTYIIYDSGVCICASWGPPSFSQSPNAYILTLSLSLCCVSLLFSLSLYHIDFAFQNRKCIARLEIQECHVRLSGRHVDQWHHRPVRERKNIREGERETRKERTQQEMFCPAYTSGGWLFTLDLSFKSVAFARASWSCARRRCCCCCCIWYCSSLRFLWFLPSPFYMVHYSV